MGCYHSCVLNSSIDDVWAAIRDFHDLSWAVGVKTLEKVGGKSGTEVGAGRILNGAIHETLLELDSDDYVIIYSIDDGPAALSKATMEGFRGVIQLSPITVGSGTFIEWSASWRSDSDGVEEFCDPIYQAGLTALQAKFG